jgi:hypothetical protein
MAASDGSRMNDSTTFGAHEAAERKIAAAQCALAAERKSDQVPLRRAQPVWSLCQCACLSGRNDRDSLIEAAVAEGENAVDQAVATVERRVQHYLEAMEHFDRIGPPALSSFQHVLMETAAWLKAAVWNSLISTSAGDRLTLIQCGSLACACNGP